MRKSELLLLAGTVNPAFTGNLLLNQPNGQHIQFRCLDVRLDHRFLQ
jgi:hypothetical protein